jgi:hypothetical protein
MRVRWALTLTAVVLLIPVSHAEGQSGALEIVQPETISLTASDDETKPVSVWVKNSSPAAVQPVFTVTLEDYSGNVLDEIEVARDDDAAIDANALARYRLSLKGAGMDKKVSGRLVVRADEPEPKVAPGSVPISAGPAPVLINSVDDVLFIPLAIAIGLLVASLVIGRSTTTNATVPMLGLDFKTSFASTLTAAGAILGIVVTSKVLPEHTSVLSKEAYTGLNLIFAIAVVVAPVVPAIWQEGDGKETRVGLFWTASVITLWAVFGELLTLWLLAGDLGSDQGFTGTATTFLKVLVVIAAVGLAIYAPWRMAAVVTAPAVAAPQTFAPQTFETAAPGIRRTPML